MKSRAAADLTESLTGTKNHTVEASVGQGLVTEASNANKVNKDTTEGGALAGIKSTYGKDLISALNNNNTNKLTSAVAAGNRQESSESNQNEGGVFDD